MDSCIFPCFRVRNREIGDGFARDCQHYHAVARIWRLWGCFELAAIYQGLMGRRSLVSTRIRSPRRPVLAHAAPDGFSALLLTKLNGASANQQRGQALGACRLGLGSGERVRSGESGALVVPEQRQFGPLEPLAGQTDGLSAVENTLDEIRR